MIQQHPSHEQLGPQVSQLQHSQGMILGTRIIIYSCIN